METKLKCSAEVWAPGRWFHSRPCLIRATVERDGKPYCRIHDPNAVTARREKRAADYAAGFPVSNGNQRKLDAYAELVAALEALVEALENALASNEYAGDMPEEWAALENTRALLTRLKIP